MLTIGLLLLLLVFGCNAPVSDCTQQPKANQSAVPAGADRFEPVTPRDFYYPIAYISKTSTHVNHTSYLVVSVVCHYNDWIMVI
jgi:hypothetical protein